MRVLACDCFHAAVGQPQLIGKDSASAPWANLSSRPASCKLCGPTRQSRAAVRCVLEGPMRASCPNITVHEMGPCKGLGTRASRPLWANSSSSARSVHSASWANLGSHSASCKLCGPTRQSRAAASCVLYGPMRAKCPNIIVHPAAHCVLDGPMRADCPNITVHETGPRKGLGTRASRPLWANPS